MTHIDRPIIITILGGLQFLSGILCLVLGAVMVAGVHVDLEMNLQGLDTAVGAVFVALGVLCMIIGYGILHGWKIMWYFGVISALVGVVMGIAGIAGGAISLNVVSLVIELIILYYLFRPGVKKFFGF